MLLQCLQPKRLQALSLFFEHILKGYNLLDLLRDIIETRTVASVLSDRLFGLKDKMNRDAIFSETIVNDTKQGKRFVVGQFVSIVTRDSNNVVLTRTPAIITRILNYASPVNEIEYAYIMPIGKMDTINDAVKGVIGGDAVDKIDSESSQELLQQLLTNRFGIETCVELKAYLTIPHIYCLETVNEEQIFKSYI